MNTEALIEWALDKVEKDAKRQKWQNILALILTFMDVICGFVAIFSSTMLVASILASVLCGTVWSIRFICFLRADKLQTALRLMTAASLAYITVRKKRSEFMSNIKVKNIVSAVLTVLGVASVAICYFVPQCNDYVMWAIVALTLVLPYDLFTTFNNARKSAEEVAKEKENAENKEKNKLIAKNEKILRNQQREQENARIRAQAEVQANQELQNRQ